MKSELWARPVYRLGQWVGALAAAGISLLTIGDVTLRFLSNNSIFGASEITYALLGILVGAGFVVVAGLRIHISIDLLDRPLRRRFPRGYARWLYVSEIAGSFVFAALLIRHAWHTIGEGELTAVLEFRIGWVHALVGGLTLAALAVLLSGWRAPHEVDARQAAE
ncbi:MAG: TRAP transporter small permease [Burkholderiales bacterium]